MRLSAGWSPYTQLQEYPGVVQQNLPEFWPKEMWPPRGLDNDPLDYYVWRFCERDVNKALIT
jgi:hypothetical protein